MCGSNPRDSGIEEQLFFPRKLSGWKSRVVGLGSPKLPFLWDGSHIPSFAAHAAAGHHLFSLDEKRGEKNQVGWHIDTPSEIILQASLRMHFEGGQGSFLDAGQRHRETTRLLALLLFSHSGSLRGRKARS